MVISESPTLEKGGPPRTKLLLVQRGQYEIDDRRKQVVRHEEQKDV